MVHRTDGALATKARAIAVAERPPVMSRAPKFTSPLQGSLFTPNVVAMPSRVAQPGRATTARSASRPRTGAARKTTRPVEEQGELEFLAPEQPKARTLATTVEATIYCEAPVATPMHRALAAVIDWTMVLIAFGMFLLTFTLCGGQFEFTRPNLLIFGGLLATIAAAYGLYWTVLGTESIGMRWTHLRLITFDGFAPEPQQRALRMVSSCLSFLSVLGVLWITVDEESLGFQDHMSRTFPTPHELETRIFQRR